MGNAKEGRKRQRSGAPITPGLHFVAVPIGNARDITLRALDILAGADVLAAEDTRSLRRLMDLHDVSTGGRRIHTYHEHNGDLVRPALLKALKSGQSVAYVSEAGTPLVSDPGYDLARAAIAEDLPVLTAPGASAILAALNVAGLPTDKFFFAGFLPAALEARKHALAELASIPATLVFYESPRRVGAMLKDASQILGAARSAAACRELTKKFEQVIRAPLGELAEYFDEHSAKGEFVVVIAKGSEPRTTSEEIQTALAEALATMSVRDAAEMVARAFGEKKRVVYQMALDLAKT